MDTTIVADHPKFGWHDYVIAWVSINERLLGEAVEQSKMQVVHPHVHTMVEQKRGDHFTYFETRHDKVPPSLTTQLKRKV